VARRSPPSVRALSDRSGALLEDAAERSRTSARARVDRLVRAGRSVAQMAVAATLAWLIATEVLGNQTPFFAPVAAIVTLGITYGSRGRRAVELALGVAIGILVADLLVLALGHGTIALGIIVGLSVTAAVLLGSGPIIVNQAGISAVLVVTIQPPGSGFVFDRFFDALVGGAIALVVGAVFLPADPLTLVRRAAGPILSELAGTLEDVARALADRDLEAAEQALLRARAIDRLGAAFHDAVAVGRETARFAPVRRRSRDQVDLYAEAAAQIDLAVRNVRVLARGTIRGVRLGESLPPEIAEAMRDLAEAVRGLGGVLEHPGERRTVIDPALQAAATATLVLERTGNLSVSVLVGQIRSTAVDLMRGAGLDYESAAQAVRDAAREAEQAAHD
jgi:uncharacterized membrane protein YgaE (UPF0421/DUF939 family)/predicted small secreted protein